MCSEAVDIPQAFPSLAETRGGPPPRPMIPPTLYGFVAVVASEQAILRLSMRLNEAMLKTIGCVSLLLACLLAAGLVLMGIWGRRPDSRGVSGKTVRSFARTICLVVCCAAAGATSSTFVALSGRQAADAVAASPVSSWEILVVSDSSLGKTGYRCRCRLGNNEVQLGDFWLTGKDRFSRGETLRCVGRYKPLEDDEWGESCRAQGVWGSISCMRVLERRQARGLVGFLGELRERVSASLDPTSSDSRAFLDACITAKRDAMTERGCDKLFSSCGVSHLVAVSGGHLAVVAALASVVLRRTRLGPGMRTAFLVSLTGLFVLFCGAPVSAVRAWIMVAVSGGAQGVGRRSHGLSSVSAVGLVMALANPSLTGQLSFTLSVTSVAALCLFSRYASYALEVLLPQPKLRGRLAYRTARLRTHLRLDLCEALAATIVAQLATMPLTIGAFGELSLVAPLANLMLGPLFTVFVSLGLVAASTLGLPVVQHIVLVPADLVGNLALTVLRTLASLPLACISVEKGSALPTVISLALLCLVLVAWPRIRPHLVWRVTAIIFACIVLLLAKWRWFAPARICVLDVGQGDAILIQDGGSALLVDAGPEGSIAQALLHEHVLHLDAVSITHLHDDHYGGVSDLVGSVPCEEVFVGAGVQENEPRELKESVQELTGGDTQELGYGDLLQVGDFEVRVVSPQAPAAGTSNGDSLMMAVTYRGPDGTLTALLTGDAEKDELEAVLNRGDVGDIDFLKVGHHGSEVSLTSQEARRLDPEVAVASAGAGNSYGHPRKECVATLEGSGATFLCTKDVGTVDIRPGNGGIRIRCDRKNLSQPAS